MGKKTANPDAPPPDVTEAIASLKKDLARCRQNADSDRLLLARGLHLALENQALRDQLTARDENIRKLAAELKRHSGAAVDLVAPADPLGSSTAIESTPLMDK